MKIILKDTHNNYIISTHRTIKAAVAARDAYSRRIKRNNGKNSYIPMSITSSDGDDISEKVMAEEFSLAIS